MSGSVKEFYETYWANGDPPPTHDALSPSRAAVLWSLVEPVRDRALRLRVAGVEGAKEPLERLPVLALHAVEDREVEDRRMVAGLELQRLE